MLDRVWAKRLLDSMSRGLIALHVLLALCYLSNTLMPMFYANALCILLNTFGLYLLKKGKARTQILMIYFSELVQLALSVLFVGHGAGFQLPLVGLTCMAFFAEYLGRSMKLAYIPAMPLAVSSFVVYALFFTRSFYGPGLAPFPESAATMLQVIWSMAVFILLIGGMLSALRLTSASEHTLTSRAETDELTGLINRAGYDRILEELNVQDAILLLVDTDKFKGINDRYGHETGDRVLQKIAKTLLGYFRHEDYVCRIGGDEFAVVLVNAGAIEDENLREKTRFINRELAGTAADELPAVSVSVGVARGSGAEDWTELFKQADTALYQVKQEGGRGCRIWGA